VIKAYYEETVRRIEDLRSLGEGEEFTGPYMTWMQLWGRLGYILHVNPRRKRLLLPLWKTLNWEKIGEQARARGLECDSVP
jgi:hypothetical protein